MTGLRRLKATLRELIASILYRTGILGLVADRRLRGRAVVLMYHRVIPRDEIAESPSHAGIIVSAESFKKQMEWLSSRFNCLSLDTFMSRLGGETPFERRSCLITFDDGWRDNYLHAYPVLRACSLPAAIFLAAGHIGSRRHFWQERLAELIRQARRLGVADPGGDDRLARCLAADDGRLQEEISELTASLKQEDPEVAQGMIERLSELVGEEEPDWMGDRHFLSWEEVRSMEAGGIEFGSHGLSHTILTRPEAHPGMETAESKRLIEQKIGKQIAAFCYPNGEHDEAVIGHVRESGYSVAFSTEPGQVAAGDDAYTIKRINIHEHMTRTIPLFLARIAGLW